MSKLDAWRICVGPLCLVIENLPKTARLSKSRWRATGFLSYEAVIYVRARTNQEAAAKAMRLHAIHFAGQLRKSGLIRPRAASGKA